MVSTVDIERARKAVASAAAAVAAAEAAPPSEGAGATWATARGRQGQAQAALDWLLQQADREREAAATRAKIEKTAGRQLDVMAAELAASAAHMTGRVQAAQEALVAALDAVGAYDALVRQHSTTVAGVGLTIVDDDQDTGARRDDVKLRGRWHLRVSAREVLAALAARVSLARLGPAGGIMNRPTDRRVAVVLADVEPVPPADLPQRVQPERPELDGPLVLVEHSGKVPPGSTRHLTRQQVHEQREAAEALAAAARITEIERTPA